MTKVRAILALVVALAGHPVLAADAGAVDAGEDCVSGPELRVAQLINDERERHGLPPLRLQDNLSASAEHEVIDAATTDTFGHGLADGTSAFANMRARGYAPRSWLGENIAGGSGTPEAAVLEAWMKSPPHRAVILSPTFRYIGVGYYRLEGSTWTTWWAAHFGAAEVDGEPVPFGEPANLC